MKKLVSGLLLAALAVPAVPVMAQSDGNWANRQRQEDSYANRDNRDDQARGDRDDRHGDWHNDSRGGWGHNDRSRHRGWGQDRGNNYNWNRGQQMGYNDWNNAQRVDYRRYHLRQPPRGYEWRRSNDRFILVAVATGVILSIILNSGR